MGIACRRFFRNKQYTTWGPEFRVRKVAHFPILMNLELLFCEFLTVKNEHFVSVKPNLNGICTGTGAGKQNVLHAHCTDIEGVKTVRPKNV